MKKVSILFVCTGNICRSPTAEGVMLKKLAAHAMSKQVRVDSAGTHGYHVGAPPDKRSQAHAEKRGYDLSKLRARRVAPADFGAFDRIIAMDHDNVSFLTAMSPPEHLGKVVLLMQHAPQRKLDIVPDPYYGGAAGFEHVLDIIEEACDGLLASLATSLRN